MTSFFGPRAPSASRLRRKNRPLASLLPPKVLQNGAQGEPGDRLFGFWLHLDFVRQYNGFTWFLLSGPSPGASKSLQKPLLKSIRKNIAKKNVFFCKKTPVARIWTVLGRQGAQKDVQKRGMSFAIFGSRGTLFDPIGPTGASQMQFLDCSLNFCDFVCIFAQI